MNAVVKLDEDNLHLLMWCVACKNLHVIHVAGENPWEWDGDELKPTINPSILVFAYPNHQPRCHSFVRDGMWQYLSDCEHDMAGQTVPMIPFKDL